MGCGRFLSVLLRQRRQRRHDTIRCRSSLFGCIPQVSDDITRQVSLAELGLTHTMPGEHLWGWKTRPHYFQDDAVRIFDPFAPGVGSIYHIGEPIYWPNPEDSWDMAFALTTTDIPIGSLTFEPNHPIPDHYWWDDPADQDNEMISLWVITDAVEAVSWDSVTLQASGTGNDAADIAAINVWLDNDNGQ